MLVLKLKKGLSGTSNDTMLTAQEDQILITDKDHSERGQTFKKSEFSSLNSGYGAIIVIVVRHHVYTRLQNMLL